LITTGRCLDVRAINIAAAAINTVSDLSILVLPQKVIWELQMSVKRKVGVSAIFLAGVL
jgi:large subunit ribosomal protein L36e